MENSRITQSEKIQKSSSVLSQSDVEKRVIQNIADRLTQVLQNNHCPYIVFSDNIALACCERCSVSPDVMVVSDKTYLGEQGVFDVPKFVLEVASAETLDTDLHVKSGNYQKIGVEEYWVYDIDGETLYIHLLSADYTCQSIVCPKRVKLTSLSVSIDFSRIYYRQ